MTRRETILAMRFHRDTAERILKEPCSVLTATEAAAHASLAVFYRLELGELSEGKR